MFLTREIKQNQSGAFFLGHPVCIIVMTKRATKTLMARKYMIAVVIEIVPKIFWDVYSCFPPSQTTEMPTTVVSGENCT